MCKGWIGVDLDGTLATFGEWVSEDHIGAPVPRMVARVKEWLAQGREVRIVTARVGAGNDSAAATDVIQKWCLTHIGQDLPVTCEKDYSMEVLYDDRAVMVETNTGRLCSGVFIDDDENIKAMRETAREIGLTKLLYDISRSDAAMGVDDIERLGAALDLLGVVE